MSKPDVQTLIENAPSLGCGIDLSRDAGEASLRCVVNDLAGLRYSVTGNTDIRTTIVETSREVSYATEGFYEAGLNVETPWFQANIKTSVTSSSKEYFQNTEVRIVGRWVNSEVKLELPDDVKPNPSFVKEIDDALKANDQQIRQRNVREVLKRYGAFYIAGVEMGGAAYMSSSWTIKESTKASAFKREVEVAAASKFGGADAKTTNSTSNSTTDKFSFKDDISRRVGGKARIDDDQAWKKTLKDWKLWRVVRPTRLRSTIDLLEEPLRKRVYDISPLGTVDINCLPEVKAAQPSEDPVFTARLLREPFPATGPAKTVPLYRSDATHQIVLVPDAEMDLKERGDESARFRVKKNDSSGTRYYILGHLFTSPTGSTKPLTQVKLAANMNILGYQTDSVFTMAGSTGEFYSSTHPYMMFIVIWATPLQLGGWGENTTTYAHAFKKGDIVNAWDL